MLKYLNDFQNQKLSVIFTKMNPNNGNETKPGIFPMDIFKSDNIFLMYCKILRYFNDFYNWHPLV